MNLRVVLPREAGQDEVERLLDHLVIELLGQRHDAVVLRPDLMADHLGQPEQVQPIHEHGSRQAEDELLVVYHP
jgi:hypothetical protein